MKKYAYSPFKAAVHRDKIDQLKRGELITPSFVQWDLSNKCNLNCSFCFYKIHSLSDWNATEIMPTDVVMRVLDELKAFGVKAIEWTGGGSVECHPDWKKIILRAKELGFEQALVTNGTLLDDEGLHIIKDFEWVRFSVDCADKKTYKKIKGFDYFDKVIHNIQKLNSIKTQNNIVGLSFIVCKDNYKEIINAARLAKELKCDNIRFSLAMTPEKEKYFKNIWLEIIKQLEQAKKEETGNFKFFSFSNRIYDLARQTLSDYCGFHHFCGVIAPRGVYPCCRLKDDAKYNLGDLKKDSFANIWFGKKRKEFIKSIENGCPFDCWMTEKNKFIEYLIKESPVHKNFV